MGCSSTGGGCGYRQGAFWTSTGTLPGVLFADGTAPPPTAAYETVVDGEIRWVFEVVTAVRWAELNVILTTERQDARDERRFVLADFVASTTMARLEVAPPLPAGRGICRA